MIVDRGTGRLDNKDVRTSDILSYLDKDLAIAEFFHLCLTERQIKVGGDIKGQFPVRVS
jgi:hypothetical protein